MANGYAGKILKVNLTTKTIDAIPTSQYEEWGGGHGIGSALFWDLCEDKTVKGDDPKNVLTVMSSPLSGTLAPSASGRTEVQGIGLQGSHGWFTRSGFGGRFGTQMKYAGWDGIAVVGKSDTQVWINIVNDAVTLEDATTLWGLDTQETQEDIWSRVLGSSPTTDWNQIGGNRDGGRTTQRPAVLTTGPNAETFGRMASLIHDSGNGAGQGGFGGVFASKNLKAVSVLGTGSIDIADPSALMDARIWLQGYATAGHWDKPTTAVGYFTLPGVSGNSNQVPTGMRSRPQGCVGCVRNCRNRTASGGGNESSCLDFTWYGRHDKKAHGALSETNLKAADFAQRRGLNAFALEVALRWILSLLQQDLIGPGKEIDSNLPYEKIGTTEFADAFTKAIVEQTDIGADLALGVGQCAEKWGRLEKDTNSGDLPLQEWGYPHHYDGRTEAEWGYGSLVGDRDINEHDFNFPCYWTVTFWGLYGVDPLLPAERMAEIFSKKMEPFSDEPKLIDYSDEGIYAESMAKLVAWHRHYTRFYKQSMLFCDWAWSDMINPYGKDLEGATGEGEPKFVNAVIGSKMTFAEGVEKGRRIWNLDRAIWTLQGRHRDMEVYAGYMYDVAKTVDTFPPYSMPVFENGAWGYKNVSGRKLDRAKVEEWKTKFYTLEGWDAKTGWPTRATLEQLNLGDVADTLEAAGKLGSA